MKSSAMAAIGILFFIIASMSAYMYVQSHVYYPVVHLALPDGLTIAAVLPAAKDRASCSNANDRFLVPFRACKECKVTTARCDRSLEGLELAMHEGQLVPHPMVLSGELRIAFIGPTKAAIAGCELVAEDMAAKGAAGAACIPPKVPAKS